MTRLSSRILAVLLVMVLFAGSALTLSAQGTATTDDIMLLQPNIKMLTDAGGQVTVGKTYSGIVDGSYTPVSSDPLIDVVFVVKSSENTVLYAPASGEQSGFTVAKISDRELHITVSEISSEGQGTVQNYGAFEFVVKNGTTPDGEYASVWIDSVSCDGITVMGDEWTAAAGYENITKTSAIAVGSNRWSYRTMGASNASYSRWLELGEYPAGSTNQLLSIPTSTAAPTVTLGAMMNGIPATGHVNTETLEFQAYLQMTGVLTIDPTLASALDTASWTQVSSGGTSTLALFDTYFKLGGQGIAQFDVYARLDDSYGSTKIIWLRFVSKSGADLSAVTNVQPSIELRNFWFASAITSANQTGTVVFRYAENTSSSTLETGFSTYKVYESDQYGTRKAYMGYSTSNATVTVNIIAAVDPGTAAQNFAEGLSKTAESWKYSLVAPGDNLGTAGDLYRSFVSYKTIEYPAPYNTSEIMNRVWFQWSLGSTTLAPGITKVEILDYAGTHYDGTEMQPIGFEAPKAGTGTTLNLYIRVGTQDILVWDGTLTAAGGEYFEAHPTNTSVYMLKTGKTIGGFSVTYTSATTVSFGGNLRVLFEAKNLNSTVTGIKLLENDSVVNVYGASDVLASETVSGSVVYKGNYGDVVDGDKNYKNLSKGSGNMTTPGDTLEYSITVNGPTSEQTGSGYARRVLVLDENNGYLNIPAPVNATVVITRASASSTVIPVSGTLASTTTVGGKTVQTYTGVNAHRTGYGITDEDRQMVFEFTGNFVTGDTIVITYQATIKDDAPVGDQAVHNIAKVHLFEYPTGGGTLVWDHIAVIGEVYVGVQPEGAFGDAYVTTTSAPATTYSDAASKQRSAFYTDEIANIYVLGGQFGSDRTITDPSYLVALPANLQLTGALDIEGNQYTLSYNGTSRVFSAATAVSDVTVVYFDSTGAVVTPTDAAGYAAVRYVRVTFDTTLGKNDVLSFNIPATATATAGTSGTGYTLQAAFIGTDAVDEPVYLNSLAGWGGARGTLSSNAWSNALRNGNTPASGYSYLTSSSTVNAHYFRNRIDVTIARNGGSGTVRLDDTVPFVINISNTVLANNMSGTHPFQVDNVVAVLPAGMELVGDTVNVAGTPVTVTKRLVDMTKGTRTIQCWQLIIPANTQVAAGTTTSITFTAKLTSLELLIDGNSTAYEAQDVAYASVYYDPDYSSLRDTATGQRLMETNSTTGIWWDWEAPGFATTAGNNRLQYTSSPITIQEKRINPGINVYSGVYNTATNSFTSQSSFVNISGPVVDWQIRVYNGSAAQYSMKDFTVAVVLPFGIHYDGMRSGPAPTGVYENADGQDVLYWVFDSALLGQATTSGNIDTDGGLKANANFALYIKTVGDSSAVGPRETVAYLIPFQGDFFEAINASYGSSKVAAGTELNQMKTWLFDPKGNHTPGDNVVHAVQFSSQVNLVQQVGAVVEKSVTNSGGKVSSSSSPTPVQVGRNEVVDFSYSFSNDGTGDAFRNIVMYDALPQPGDRHTLVDKPRNSQFAMEMVWGSDPTSAFTVTLNGAVVNPSLYTISYSDAAAVSQAGWEKNSWTDASSWAAADTTPASFRIVFDLSVKVAQGETLIISWQMQMPADPDPSLLGARAYNSAALKFTQQSGISIYSYCVEPAKCGVNFVGDYGLSITQAKMWYDPLAVGYGTFEFKLEWMDPVMGWQLVNIDPSQITGGTVTRNGHFSISLQSGQMVGATISDLIEGNYRITEVTTFSAYTIVNGQRTFYLNANTSGGYYITYNLYQDPGTPPITPPPGGGEEEPGPGPGGEDEITPPGPPTAIIPEPDIPEAGEGPRWSLVNLICSILGGVEAIALAVEYIVLAVRKNRKRKDVNAANGYVFKREEGEVKDSNVLMKVVSVLISIATGVLFFVLEGIKGQMTLFTRWSFIIIPVFVVGVLLGFIEHRMRNKERTEEE